MAKDITFTDIIGLEGKIVFNYQDSGPDYYLAAIRFEATSKGSGARRALSRNITLGTPSASPFTAKQIYTAVKAKMGQDVADKIKEIYLDGIDEDISI